MLSAPSAAPPKELLTTAEAAEFLAIEPTTLERWRGRKTGPNFVKIGGAVRYRIADLQAYLTSRIVMIQPKSSRGGKS